MTIVGKRLEKISTVPFVPRCIHLEINGTSVSDIYKIIENSSMLKWQLKYNP
jgi:hypothetical protein